MTLEVTPADAYRMADHMLGVGAWFVREQRLVGDELVVGMAGMTARSETDQIVAMALARILDRVTGVGLVLEGVGRNLRESGLDYEETDSYSASLFLRAEQGWR